MDVPTDASIASLLSAGSLTPNVRFNSACIGVITWLAKSWLTVCFDPALASFGSFGLGGARDDTSAVAVAGRRRTVDVSPVVFFEAECIAADDDAGRTVLVLVMALVLAIAFVLATRSATSSRFSSSDDDDDESSESTAGIGGGDGGFVFVGAGVFSFFLCSGSFAFFVGAGPKPKSIRGLAPLGTVIFPTSTFSSFGAGSPLGLDGVLTGAVLTARSIRARIARGLVPGRSFHRDTNNVGGRSPTDSFNCKNKTRRHSNCPYKY